MDGKNYFIEPLDVLFLRGNKLFGDPGSFGESLIPPWPSVAAGALRSALLVHKGHDLAGFARGEIVDDPELGTPEKPGSFTLTSFQLARRYADQRVEPLFPLPADLVVGKPNTGEVEIRKIAPYELIEEVTSSSVTQRLAILPEKERAKPVRGLWLNAEGWSLHLQCGPPQPNQHLVSSDQLWSVDTRVGVGLDLARRRAEEGKLFTVEAVALRKIEHDNRDEDGLYDVGFLTRVAGAKLPAQVTLRLGGDGRGALAHEVRTTYPEADYTAIAQAGRCRLILTTPGLFVGGWRPTGTSGDGPNLQFDLHGVRAKLVCAAVPRAVVVSGFDLAAWRPKPAQRFAPTGSVYWLDELEATPDALRKLAENGLWSSPPENAGRCAEGFNRCTVAAY